MIYLLFSDKWEEEEYHISCSQQCEAFIFLLGIPNTRKRLQYVYNNQTHGLLLYTGNTMN